MKRIFTQLVYVVLRCLAGALWLSIEFLLWIYNVVDGQIYEIQRARLQD